jgi:hypothetical protein
MTSTAGMYTTRAAQPVQDRAEMAATRTAAATSQAGSGADADGDGDGGLKVTL